MVCLGSWLCGNSDFRSACRNFRFDFSNLKNNIASDYRREKTIEKTILRVPRARTFLHSLGHELP